MTSNCLTPKSLSRVGEVLLNFVCNHLPWVTFVAEEDVSPDPTDVGLLGANGIAPGAYRIANAIEQSVLTGFGHHLPPGTHLHSSGVWCMLAFR